MKRVVLLLSFKDIKENEEDIKEMADLLRGVPKELRLPAKCFLLGVQTKDETAKRNIEADKVV